MPRRPARQGACLDEGLLHGFRVPVSWRSGVGSAVATAPSRKRRSLHRQIQLPDAPPLAGTLERSPADRLPPDHSQPPGFPARSCAPPCLQAKRYRQDGAIVRIAVRSWRRLFRMVKCYRGLGFLLLAAGLRTVDLRFALPAVPFFSIRNFHAVCSAPASTSSLAAARRMWVAPILPHPPATGKNTSGCSSTNAAWCSGESIKLP